MLKKLEIYWRVLKNNHLIVNIQIIKRQRNTFSLMVKTIFFLKFSLRNKKDLIRENEIHL